MGIRRQRPSARPRRRPRAAALFGSRVRHDPAAVRRQPCPRRPASQPRGRHRPRVRPQHHGDDRRVTRHPPHGRSREHVPDQTRPTPATGTSPPNRGRVGAGAPDVALSVGAGSAASGMGVDQNPGPAVVPVARWFVSRSASCCRSLWRSEPSVSMNQTLEAATDTAPSMRPACCERNWPLDPYGTGHSTVRKWPLDLGVGGRRHDPLPLGHHPQWRVEKGASGRSGYRNVTVSRWFGSGRAGY